MDPLEYQRLALSKEADQNNLHSWYHGLGSNATRLANAARGLADDSGEVSGVIKKWLEYQQPLDVGHLIEEVGDCLWRLAQVAAGGGFTLAEAMAANLAKLDVRYGTDGKCTPELAAEKARDRTAEAEAIEKVHRQAQDCVQLWVGDSPEAKKIAEDPKPIPLTITCNYPRCGNPAGYNLGNSTPATTLCEKHFRLVLVTMGYVDINLNELAEAGFSIESSPGCIIQHCPNKGMYEVGAGSGMSLGKLCFFHHFAKNQKTVQ